MGLASEKSTSDSFIEKTEIFQHNIIVSKTDLFLIVDLLPFSGRSHLS